MCDDRGLSKHGKKMELAERIMAYDNSRRAHDDGDDLESTVSV